MYLGAFEQSLFPGAKTGQQLEEERRLAFVAMTRARKKLIVIGDSATLSRHPFYADLVAYAESHNAYKSAWEENWSM